MFLQTLKITILEFYQWLVPLMAIFYAYRIVKQYIQKKRLLKGTVLWLLVWLLVSILAIVPDFVSVNLAKLLGFKDHINGVIFIAIGFLFLFNMYFNVTIEKLENQMTDLVRKQALENQELKQKLLDYEKQKIAKRVASEIPKGKAMNDL